MKNPLFEGIFEGRLALFLFDFVTTKVFLRFGKNDVFFKNRVVFTEGEFIRSVHGVFLSIILTNSGFFGDETDELAFGIIFLSHS